MGSNGDKMILCARCRSCAINPKAHGREPGVDLDLCDVCYWRKQAETLVQKIKEWSHLSDAGMRLRCGDMTAQEIRTVRAVLNALPKETK
jgi:hypothetical protein